MKVIVGLGNPGKSYEKTRHNAGHECLEFFREFHGLPAWKDSVFQGVISEGIIEGEKIILVKPMTYMNLSGESIEKICSYYKINIKSDLLIISDDIDMVFGKIRIRKEGSHGGQNGLRHTIERLGTHEFARLKIGIGRHEHMNVSDWVLSKFSKEELRELEENIFPEVEKIISQWIQE